MTRGADIWGATRGAEICGATEMCGAAATCGTGAAGVANPPLPGCAPAEVVASAVERMTNVAVRMLECNITRDSIGARPSQRPGGVLVAPVQAHASEMTVQLGNLSCREDRHPAV
jgi:hypothetical protein